MEARQKTDAENVSLFVSTGRLPPPEVVRALQRSSRSMDSLKIAKIMRREVPEIGHSSRKGAVVLA